MGEIIKTIPTQHQQIIIPKLKYMNKIQEKRTNKGITATYMAKKLGYSSVAAYRKIELGQVKVPIPLGIEIADILGVDFIELFFE